METKSFIRILAVICAVFIIASSLAVFAAADHTETINLGNVRKNESGAGYTWNNPDRILTLDGIDISTEDDFGLKLPDNCTVVLKGTNRIKASKYGIGVPGSVVFEGSGKLIVEGSESAIYNYSYSDNHKMRLSSGTYTLIGGCAVMSDHAEISVTGGDFVLKASDDVSVKGRVFSMSGGTLEAEGAIHTSHLLSVDRGEITVSATGAALVSSNHLKLENVRIKAGESKSSLADADDYAGESCVMTDPIAKGARDSILFGEGTPITVDYILLAAAVLLVAAGIAVPYVHKKKKVRALYERLEAERVREAEEKKKKKSENKTK